MINPYEPITAGALDIPGVPQLCAESSYRCPKCLNIFEINNYELLEVYFGVDLVKCDCCTSYSWSLLYDRSFEYAWYCGDGCFNHDKGASPKDGAEKLLGIEVGWICRKGELHQTEEEALNC